MTKNQTNNWTRIRTSLLLGTLIFGLLLGGLVLVAFALNSYDENRYSGATLKGLYEAAMRIIDDKSVFSAILNTLYLAFKGFILGVLLSGFTILILGHWPEKLSKAIPIFNAIRAVPLTLLVPILVLVPTFYVLPPWSLESSPARDPAYLISLGTYLYILIGFAEGVANSNELRSLITRRVLGFSRTKHLFRVVLYEAASFTFASMRLAILFAIVLAIVLEQILSYPGIGFIIMQKFQSIPSSGYSLLDAECLVLIFIVSLIGVIVDSAFILFRKLIIYWPQS